MPILSDIPFTPDVPWLLKRLRIKVGKASEREFLSLVEQARSIARPRALYLPVYITERGSDWLTLNNTRFDSRVLSVNLGQSHRVFPYLATCGIELQEWVDGMEDPLANFWGEAVKEAALSSALGFVFADMDARYRPGKTASMSPGSLTDWPIEQQRPLFALFGEDAAAIGVCLNESCLMLPTKSVSGIRFPTEMDFESCQLCPRDGCPGRRAVYDPGLYDSRYCQEHQPGPESISSEMM